MAATTTEAPKPAATQYVDYDEYVDYQLEKARSRIKTTDIFTTLTTLAALVVLYLLVFVLCDHWLLDGGFSYGARVTLITILGGILVGVLGRQVIWPLLRRIHPLYAARVIERADPRLQSNLLNFVDLRQSNAAGGNAALQAMEKRAAVELSKIDVEETVDHRPLLRWMYVLLGAVAVSALYIVFSPKDALTSVKRALLPTAPIAVATETTIADVTPGDELNLPARATLTVEANVRGPEAENVRILYTTADHKYVDQPVEMRRIEEGLPRFRGVLNGENGRGLLQDLTYRLVAGDARSVDYAVHVIQPPSARVDNLHITFPTYMRLEEKNVPGGHIDAWEGAVVDLTATANMPVKKAHLVFTDNESTSPRGEEVGMTVTDGTKLTARWPLRFRDDGTFARFYHLHVETAKGEVDPEPTQYTIRIRPDQRPEVELLAPKSDPGDKAANAIIPLVIQAADPDFGLRSITLKIEKGGEPLPDQNLFEDRELGREYRGSYNWDLGKMRTLIEGDQLQFWIEVRDNKQPIANRATTPKLHLRIGAPKSADEVKQDLAADTEKNKEELAQSRDDLNPDRDPTAGRKNDDDSAGGEHQPPDRPEPADDARKPARPEEATADEPDEQNSEPGSTKREGERNRKHRDEKRDPKDEEYEKALERLTKPERQEDRTPDEQESADENKDNRKPSEDGKGKTGSKAGSGNKNKPATDSGDKDAEKPAPTGDQPPGDESDRDNDGSGNDGHSKDNSKDKPKRDKPGTEPGKNSADKNSAKPKKPSDKSAEDKTPPENPSDGGSKNNSTKDTSKENGSKENATGGSGSKDDQNAPSKDDKNNSAADKDKSKTPKGSKGDKSGDKASGDKSDENKDSGKSPDGSLDNPEKTEGGAGEQPSPDNKSDKGPDGQKPGDKSSDSDDASNPDNSKDKNDGTPGKPKKKGGPEQPGDAPDGDKSPRSDKDKPASKKSTDPNASGEKQPAEDSDAAAKQKATGDEEGEATGSENKDPDAVKAKNVKKKPGSKQGQLQESKDDKDKDSGKKPRADKNDDRQDSEGTSSANDDAQKTKAAPKDKKEKPEQPGQLDDPPSEKPDKDQKRDDRSQQPQQAPEGGNQPQKGKGRKDGQASEQPDTGEQGDSTASDQGTEGGNKQGAGDKDNKPGNANKSDKSTGEPGDEKGDGSTTKPSDSGKKSGDGAGKKSSGQPGGQSDASKDGSKGGAKGDQPGRAGPSGDRASGSGVTGPPDGDGRSPSDAGTGDGDSRSRSGTGGDENLSPEEADKANLEAARKATNLVLKRLKKQLERGEVDEKLLEELGWDRAELEKFTKYLEEQLDERREDNSPEAQAKRLQFEEFLKSLSLGSETQRFKGDSTKQRRLPQTGPRTTRPPPEYLEQYEAYTKSRSKEKRAAPDKSEKVEKKK